MYEDRLDRLNNKLKKLFFIIHDLSSEDYKDLIKANSYYNNINNNINVGDKIILWHLEKSEKIVKNLLKRYNKQLEELEERFKVKPTSTRTKIRKAKKTYVTYAQRKLNKSENSKKIRNLMKGKR